MGSLSLSLALSLSLSHSLSHSLTHSLTLELSLSLSLSAAEPLGKRTRTAGKIEEESLSAHLLPFLFFFFFHCLCLYRCGALGQETEDGRGGLKEGVFTGLAAGELRVCDLGVCSWQPGRGALYFFCLVRHTHTHSHTHTHTNT